MLTAPKFFEDQQDDVAAGAQVVGPPDEGQVSFGPGSGSRKTLIVWLGAVAWLVIVWRAVEGY